ncbi:MAG: TIGR02679 domain-containing protein [Defluviitaleaceae bacterium]|nr:TIGR02679 domain-containing protein [Defluviitaleaceae bacterium]
MDAQIDQIVQFFKSNPGFGRIIHAMFDMYVQYERAFGAVRLIKPREEEEEALSKFFSRDYYNQALIRIGLADFERQMCKNFLSDVSLGDVLAQYIGKPVKKATESNMKKPTPFAAGVLSLVPKFKNTQAEIWLKEISAHTRRTYRAAADSYLADPKSALRVIRQTADALNDVGANGKLVPLAEFSEKHTGSPGAFDFSGTHGQLFLKALASKFDVALPTTAEGCVFLHYRAGLLSNGMLSSVTVFGLSADSAHYENLNQAQVLTLENINSLSHASAHGGKVFILEEPQIFSAVLTRLKCDTGGVKRTIVCPTGGFNAAFVCLMELLRGADMYFAGGMNYKGLEFADKLYEQFRKNFVPWRYTREDYAKVIAVDGGYLTGEKRGLAMHNESLASLLSHIKKTGRTASSLPLVDDYVSDIKKIVQ